MKLVEALTDLGNEPVSRLPNYRAVLAFLNASFKRAGMEIVQEIATSDVVLEQIYSMEDPVLQSLVLGHPITELKGATKFKNILVYSGGLLTMFFISMVIMSIIGGPLSPELIDLFKQLGLGLLEIFKALAVSGAT